MCIEHFPTAFAAVSHNYMIDYNAGIVFYYDEFSRLRTFNQLNDIFVLAIRDKLINSLA